MKILALFSVFVLTVLVLTAAWRMSIGPRNSSLLPVSVGFLIAWGTQWLTWNRLCRFPERVTMFVGVGLPLALTLIALLLGICVLGYYHGVFYPSERYDNTVSESVSWRVATAFTQIGIPAFVMGVLLLGVCCAAWLRNR